MFGRYRTPPARPSLLMFRIDRHIARLSSSLVLYRVPRGSSFTLAKRFVIAWTHIEWVRWMFQSFPLPAAQEVRDSSSVTPCIDMKNDAVLYHQVSSFSPESMRLRSLRQSERTTARDPVQHKRWIYPWYRAVNIELKQRWTHWWFMTPSKHFAESDK